jgi:hypothetical protein
MKLTVPSRGVACDYFCTNCRAWKNSAPLLLVASIEGAISLLVPTVSAILTLDEEEEEDANRYKRSVLIPERLQHDAVFKQDCCTHAICCTSMEKWQLNPRQYSSICTRGPPYYGVRSGGLPKSMWGSHQSLGLCEKHATRTTIVLAFWKIYDTAILIMFNTS